MAFQGPVLSFQLPQIPRFFDMLKPREQFDMKEKKRELLESISNTNNGKSATSGEQRSILSLVRKIETSAPPPATLFTDAAQIRLLQGVWFLKYTSPSSIDNDDGDDGDGNGNGDGTVESEADEWTATVAEDARIETRQIRSKGSVSAAGITVDVSDRDTRQILDFGTDGPTIRNEVELDFATVVVGGGLTPSERVYNRAVASFTECKFLFTSGFVLDLSFLFAILSIARGTTDAGWLETTYVDEDLRIGRGNKGTMFILTRDRDAVAN